MQRLEVSCAVPHTHTHTHTHTHIYVVRRQRVKIHYEQSFTECSLQFLTYNQPNFRFYMWQDYAAGNASLRNEITNQSPLFLFLPSSLPRIVIILNLPHTHSSPISQSAVQSLFRLLSFTVYQMLICLLFNDAVNC